MATLSAIMSNLRADLESDLVSFTATEFPQKRFELRQPDEMAARSINDATGRERLFEFGDIESMVIPWCGSANRGYEVRFSLRVNYPNTTAWQIAAMDDFDRLAEYWRDNNCTVTGVAWRGYDNETQHLVEPHADDPWTTNSLQILALLEITP